MTKNIHEPKQPANDDPVYKVLEMLEENRDAAEELYKKALDIAKR